MSAIDVILTGGTIEKAYDPLTEKPEFRYQSIIPGYMKDMVKPYPDLCFRKLCQIDSLDMTNENRAEIAEAIKSSAAQKILIIHGTGTMTQTGQYLETHLGSTGKTVILTGAMVPLKEFAMSDAGFNLGYALACLEYAPAGVYVAMNANLFKAKDVKKNLKQGRFETC